MTARLVVLVSGEGSILQSLLDATQDEQYGARVVAVGADRDGIPGLERAAAAGVPSFALPLQGFPDRAAWDEALAAAIGEHSPDLVVLAGFMKILGAPVIERFGARMLNTHPALLPSFPGAHGVRDALEHGVTVTGATVHLVTAELDAGPIVAQAAVDVLPDDDEASLHERIKQVERRLYVDTIGRLAREGWTVTGRKVRVGK